MKAFAMLTAAVLVVIGIGVGIVAATGNPPTYGPPGARFTAEFPAQPSVLRGCSVFPKCSSVGIREVFLYEANPALVEVWLGSRSALSTVNNPSKWEHLLPYPWHLVRLHLGDGLTGFRGLLCGPAPPLTGKVSGTFCTEAQIEGDSQAVWEARLSGPREAVNSFLASFYPLP